MKKQVLLTLCVGLLLTAAHAQLRSYVGIVQEMPNNEMSEFYKELAKKLTDDGFRTYATAVNNYMKTKSFGSGFVYVAPDGKNYVITNNHVVGNALLMSIEFQLPDGKVEKYENLRVLVTSSELDLAILVFPSTRQPPFTASIPFAKNPVTDGQAVWSAGFPGLAGEPTWQLGNGVITNSLARVPYFVNPEISTLIQHSAQVDPGNSGGPLLIESSTSPAKYEIVGINTWGFRNRQAANFALPAAAIKNFIDTALKTDVNKTEQITATTNSFVKAVMSKTYVYDAVAPYISYQYIYDNGYAAFKKMIEKAPTSIRQEISAVFINGSPLEALRYAIAYTIVNELRPENKGDPKTDAIKQTSPELFDVSFLYLENKPALTSVWNLEQGAWRIKSFGTAIPEKKSSGKGGIGASTGPKLSSPYKIFIDLAYDLSVPVNNYSHGFTAMAMFYPGRGTTIWGYGLLYQMDNVLASQTDKYGSSTDRYSYMTRHSFGISTGFRVPVDFGSFNLMPYVNGAMTMNFTSTFSSIDFIVSPGIYAGLGVKLPVNVLLGVSYKYQYSIPLAGNLKDPNKHGVTFSAVLGF